MKSGGSLSIWFFTGLCLGVTGALIFATGIYELMSPPTSTRSCSTICTRMSGGARSCWCRACSSAFIFPRRTSATHGRQVLIDKVISRKGLLCLKRRK